MENRVYTANQNELFGPEIFTPESVLPVAQLLPVYARIDLTQQQKRYLKERDVNCQFPYHHICTGTLHLHHVIPQMFAQIVRGEHLEQVNDRNRILRICENIHVGMLGIAAHPELLHPDTLQAKRDYAVDRHSFQDVAEKHRGLALQGEPYWYTLNDEELLDIAAFNTRIFERKYQKPYPIGGVVNGKVVRK